MCDYARHYRQGETTKLKATATQQNIEEIHTLFKMRHMWGSKHTRRTWKTKHQTFGVGLQLNAFIYTACILNSTTAQKIYEKFEYSSQYISIMVTSVIVGQSPSVNIKVSPSTVDGGSESFA